MGRQDMQAEPISDQQVETLPAHMHGQPLKGDSMPQPAMHSPITKQPWPVTALLPTLKQALGN